MATLTERQADQQWLEDTRAEYLRRATPPKVSRGAFLDECKNAMLAALQGGLSPEEAADRLYPQYRRLMTRDKMLTALMYAAAVYRKHDMTALDAWERRGG